MIMEEFMEDEYIDFSSSDFIDDFPEFTEDDEFEHVIWQDFDESEWRPDEIHLHYVQLNHRYYKLIQIHQNQLNYNC